LGRLTHGSATVPPTAAIPADVSADIQPFRGRRKTFLQRFLALFAHNHLGNFLFISAVFIGFFHGWIKLHYRTGALAGLTTFAFDIPLGLALAVTLLKIPKSSNWFPPSPTGMAIRALTVIAILYLIAPFGVPIIAGVSALRAWCFIPMIYLLGFHLTRSVRQVETYFWIIIGLGVVTAVYGLRQTPEEIRRLMELDPTAKTRLMGTFYATATGEAKLRAFSTFVSAGAFGTTMAYSIMFALARFTVPGNRWTERIILGVAAAVMTSALLATASRSSLIMMGLGLFATAWYRRSFLQLLVLPAIAAVAYKLATQDISYGNSERFGSLLDFDTVIGRVYIGIAPALDSLAKFPLGGGLGRSGHGMPFMFYYLKNTYDIQEADGDLGRLLIDMGVIGFVAYFAMMTAGTREAFRCMRDLRETPLGVVGTPGGAMFAISIVMIPTGSPFLGIPSGALLWFFLGALERLTEEYHKAAAVSPEAARYNPMFVSFIEPPKQRTLFDSQGEKPALIDNGSFAQSTAFQKPREKRFLFSKPTENSAGRPATPGRRMFPGRRPPPH
jgi:hypothetical protein